jgi:Transposase
VLAVGIDWAEEFHLVALGSPGEGVLELLRVEHTPTAVQALLVRIAGLEPDPAEVRVVIETRHGLLVERLLDAGFTVLPVNPELITRRRGPARKKDDAEDARLACLLALDRHAGLRPLLPHRELAGEVRAIARDDERAARDERRLLNRLPADLVSTFPAALQIAGDRLGGPTMLGCGNAGRPARPCAPPPARSCWRSRWPASTAGRNAWPTRSPPRWPPTTSPHATTWCGPSPTPSGWPPPSCWPSGPSGECGSGAWASCCWAPHAMGEPSNRARNGRGARSLAVRST